MGILKKQTLKIAKALQKRVPLISKDTTNCPHCGIDNTDPNNPQFQIQPAGFPLRVSDYEFANLIVANCIKCNAEVVYVHLVSGKELEKVLNEIEFAEKISEVITNNKEKKQ